VTESVRSYVMPSVGIITCEILELEWAEILSHDPDIVSLTMLHSPSCHGFVEAMETRTGARPQSIVHVSEFSPSPQESLNVLIHVLEVGLHTVIKELKDAVTKATFQMGPYVDAVLLGYGLCGNALNNLEDLVSGVALPVFIPMDEDHPVDDCLGLIIGGREKYYEAQCTVAGTMFMNSGFSRHWKQMLERLCGGRFDSVMSKRLLANYERSLLLPTRVLSQEEMASNIREFNEMFGLRMEVQPGTLEMLETAWGKAKAYSFPSGAIG
jgi:hypothetical protein